MSANLKGSNDGIHGELQVGGVTQITFDNAGNTVQSGTATVGAATAASQAVQAGQTIGRNVIVNGGCEVSQVNGTTATTPISGAYPIDNWLFGATQASKFQTQTTTVILNSLGSTNALSCAVLASYSPIALDQFYYQVPVEGYNFARFAYGTANAKAGSLQFKVRASVAGTYSGAIQNYAATRSYLFSFTLLANTDTLITVPNIPGDTGGVWAGNTNAGAAQIRFDLGAGTTFKSTAGTWQAGNYIGVTGATNLVSQVNGSTLTITDVQFEVGAFCTTYERKLYDQVLRECQRYLPVIASSAAAQTIGTAFAASGLQIYGIIQFPVPARIPTTSVTITANGINFANAINYPYLSGLTTIQPSITCATLGFVPTGVPATNSGGILTLNANTLAIFTGAQI
jgi:hypothetical protein